MKVLMFGWEYPPHVYGDLLPLTLVYHRDFMPKAM